MLLDSFKNEVNLENKGGHVNEDHLKTHFVGVLALISRGGGSLETITQLTSDEPVNSCLSAVVL